MPRGDVPADVREIIERLSTDTKLIGVCEKCESAAPMGKWNLFYTDHYPTQLKELVEEVTSVPADLKKEYQDLKMRGTKLAAKK